MNTTNSRAIKRRHKRVIAIVVGTRPEAIKLAPVYVELKSRGASVVLIETGQHPELCSEALSGFKLTPDYQLLKSGRGQPLSELAGQIMIELSPVLEKIRASDVIIQGDTISALTGALVGFYQKLAVYHVEAGLRSGNMQAPWPEEANRKLIDLLATWWFPPTQAAKNLLLSEGTNPARIVVTGNTGIDALLSVASPYDTDSCKLDNATQGSPRRILVTLHRRENFGPALERVCLAIRKIVEMREEVRVTLPIHPNPAVEPIVRRILGDLNRVRLIAPLPYRSMVRELSACDLVLTDSGGLQEEAPALGKPVVIARNETERTEGVEVGAAVLGGTTKSSIFRAINRILSDAQLYERMALAPNPYGDGKAAARIVDIVLQCKTNEWKPPQQSVRP